MKSKVHESLSVYSTGSNPLSGLSTRWKIGLGLFAGALAVGAAGLAANEEENRRERERHRSQRDRENDDYY